MIKEMIDEHDSNTLWKNAAPVNTIDSSQE